MMLYPSQFIPTIEATSLIQLSAPQAQTTVTTPTQFDPSHRVAEGEESEFNRGGSVLKSCTFVEKISISKSVKIKHEHALKQWQCSQLSLRFCPTHICMCFRFQWCINKQQPSSEARVPGCIWGLSVVITDHLIIITTIKNESVQACDIWMANTTG